MLEKTKRQKDVIKYLLVQNCLPTCSVLVSVIFTMGLFTTFILTVLTVSG